MRERLALFLVVGLFACGDDDNGNGGTPDARPAVDAAVPDAAGGPDAMNAQVARGSYLVNTVMLCIDCHTPRLASGAFDTTKHLSGVECFIDAIPASNTMGCLHSRNLTNHATGLMNRTNDQIKKMFLDGERPDGTFLDGERPDGTFLVNVMPYWSLHRMTAEDADAIVAYLRTVPGVDHQVPANEVPFNIVPAATAPMTDAETLSVTATVAGTTQASADRGRYLANFACVDCHTPLTAPGSPRPLDFSKAFQGGRSFDVGPPFGTVWTMNLTPHANGLAGWTVADIVKVLKQGKDKNDMNVCPPMPSAYMGPLQGITDADATDIANYLVNLPPGDNMIPMQCVGP
jgi:mono/diheme cytochrome c family protein